jgi:hypothetical protein
MEACTHQFHAIFKRAVSIALHRMADANAATPAATTPAPSAPAGQSAQPDAAKSAGSAPADKKDASAIPDCFADVRPATAHTFKEAQALLNSLPDTLPAETKRALEKHFFSFNLAQQEADLRDAIIGLKYVAEKTNVPVEDLREKWKGRSPEDIRTFIAMQEQLAPKPSADGKRPATTDAPAPQSQPPGVSKPIASGEPSAKRTLLDEAIDKASEKMQQFYKTATNETSPMSLHDLLNPSTRKPSTGMRM